MKYTPTRVRTMWPALMFAASRTDSVIGRTKVLTVSIKMRKGFNHAGAPPGKSAARVDVGLKVEEDRMSLSHKGRPSANVKTR